MVVNEKYYVTDFYNNDIKIIFKATGTWVAKPFVTILGLHLVIMCVTIKNIGYLFNNRPVYLAVSVDKEIDTFTTNRFA